MIPCEIREVLEKRFEAGECSIHPYHKWTYVEGHRVIQRLNDAFEAGWSHRVTERWREGDTLCVVVRFSANTAWQNEHGFREETTVEHDGIGCADVKYRKCKKRTCEECATNPNHAGAVDIGSDWKSAATDGLKKAATHLVVALHLYNSEDPIHFDTREDHHRRKGERMTPNFNTGIQGGGGWVDPAADRTKRVEAVATVVDKCGKCGGGVWDHREKSATGWRGPVFKCKDKACDWVQWKNSSPKPVISPIAPAPAEPVIEVERFDGPAGPQPPSQDDIPF